MGNKPGKPSRPARYDPKVASGKHGLVTTVAPILAVLVFAAAVFGYILWQHHRNGPGESRAVQVTSAKLVTKDGTDEPKAVMTFYEDFLCPACGNFERRVGPTVNRLIDIGAIRADYYMVALLDSPANQHYSSRAAGSAYCVADENLDAFRRFHSMLFSERLQPDEVGPEFPDDSRLIETARQAGVVGTVPGCINSGRYLKLARAMVADIPPSPQDKNQRGTPTILINGEYYKPSTPEALVSKITEIVGDIPGIDTVVPAGKS